MSNNNDRETSLLIALLQECDYDAAKKLLNVNPSCCYDIDRETSMIALYFALESTEMTQLLLNLNPDSIRFKTKIGNLPLHYACQKNCLLQTIQLLLDIYPDAASIKNNDGKLPLHYSSSVGISANKNVIDLLLKNHPLGISEKENKNNSYPLHYACAFKAPHDVVLKLLLASPLMCKECDKSGNLPIHLAIIYGLQPNSILSIIDSYRNCVFEHDSKGRLPLHLASQFNCHHSVISILIDANRNAIYEKDKLGRTPLLISIKYNLSCESLELLIKNDNTLYNIENSENDQISASYGVIHMAISYGCSCNVIKLIAELAPQSVIQLSGDGKLPIHVAIWQKSDIDVVKVLINAYPEGLKIKETVYQNLPLHYAAQYKADAKIAEVVLTSYSDAALIQNGYGRLPIHLAARFGASVEFMKSLLKFHPFSTGIVDKRNLLPIDYALEYGASSEIVSLLFGINKFSKRNTKTLLTPSSPLPSMNESNVSSPTPYNIDYSLSPIKQLDNCKNFTPIKDQCTTLQSKQIQDTFDESDDEEFEYINRIIASSKVQGKDVDEEVILPFGKGGVQNGKILINKIGENIAVKTIMLGNGGIANKMKNLMKQLGIQGEELNSLRENEKVLNDKILLRDNAIFSNKRDLLYKDERIISLKKQIKKLEKELEIYENNIRVNYKENEEKVDNDFEKDE